MRLFGLTFLALSCEACRSCVTPSIPDVDDGDDSFTDSAETGDSTTPIDTSPEPECVFPEIEPNDYVGSNAGPPTLIAMEEWACGDITTTGDTDQFQVTADQTVDWIRFEVVAAAEGSSLDASLLLLDEDYSAAADDSDTNSAVTDDPNDPVISFQAPPAPHTYDFMVRSIDWTAGEDDYHYKTRVRSVKAPLTWTLDEVEVNDPGLGGTYQSLTNGDRVFGTFSGATDVDAFTFEVPKVGEDDKVSVTVDVDAFRYGSPALAEFTILSPTGVVVRSDRSHDEFGRLGDPWWKFSPSEIGTYVVWVDLRKNTGGLASWYVLSVDVDVQGDP